MRLIVSAFLVSCLVRPVLAQTSQRPQVDVSRPQRVTVVKPRKERPSIMEALMQKDKRLTAIIRKIAIRPPDKSK